MTGRSRSSGSNAFIKARFVQPLQKAAVSVRVRRNDYEYSSRRVAHNNKKTWFWSLQRSYGEAVGHHS